MAALDDETQIRTLLAPLGRVEPVTLPRKRRSRRPALIGGLLALAILASGVAIADGVNPFAGIGAANHARRSQDALPPAALAFIKRSNAHFATIKNGSRLLPDTPRLLDTLPSGTRL